MIGAELLIFFAGATLALFGVGLIALGMMELIRRIGPPRKGGS